MWILKWRPREQCLPGIVLTGYSQASRDSLLHYCQKTNVVPLELCVCTPHSHTYVYIFMYRKQLLFNVVLAFRPFSLESFNTILRHMLVPIIKMLTYSWSPMLYEYKRSKTKANSIFSSRSRNRYEVQRALCTVNHMSRAAENMWGFHPGESAGRCACWFCNRKRVHRNWWKLITINPGYNLDVSIMPHCCSEFTCNTIT